MCMAIGGVPFPVSMWNGVRVLVVTHSPRPFHPPFGLSMRPSKAVLRLHVSRLFSILPSPRIRVPREHQEELEAILKRHLNDWPQA